MSQTLEREIEKPGIDNLGGKERPPVVEEHGRGGDGLAETTDPPKPPRSHMSRWIFVVVAAVAAAGVGFWWMDAQKYESTDDAQVEGHLDLVSSRISGTVISINPRVENNQTIEAGTLLLELDPRDYAGGAGSRGSGSRYAQCRGAVGPGDDSDHGCDLIRPASFRGGGPGTGCRSGRFRGGESRRGTTPIAAGRRLSPHALSATECDTRRWWESARSHVRIMMLVKPKRLRRRRRWNPTARLLRRASRKSQKPGASWFSAMPRFRPRGLHRSRSPMPATRPIPRWEG